MGRKCKSLTRAWAKQRGQYNLCHRLRSQNASLALVFHMPLKPCGCLIGKKTLIHIWMPLTVITNIPTKDKMTDKSRHETELPTGEIAKH